MVRFTHEEIPSDSENRAGYGFAKDVARQARNAACSLYDKYPAAATAGTIPGSPAHQWMKGFWEDMCAKAPGERPPDPESPFNGGQCQCIPYLINFRIVRGDGTSSGISTVTRTGPIIGFTSQDSEFGTRSFICISTNCSTTPPSQTTSVINTAFTVDEPTLEVISITRADGLPDNCGNPPASYVPPYNGTPLDSEKEVPYEPKEPGGTGVGIGIIVPFVFIKPEVAVNVDVGGVEVKFDLGGVEFNITNKFGDGEPGSVGSEPPDLTKIEQLAREAKEAAEESKEAAEGAKKLGEDAANNDGDHPQNDPNKQEKETKQEDDPKEEDAIERLLAVQVELLSMPSNRRTQDGGDAPDVQYAGWFEWKTKGTPHPRVPIHFERNYFTAPVGADGYAYTVYNGFTARAIVITAKATP